MRKSQITIHKSHIPSWLLASLLLTVSLSALVLITGSESGFVMSLATAVTEGGLAAAIFVAAGGFGWLLLRPLMPRDASRCLRVATACGLGLWLLATALLAAGTFIDGSLTGHVWWPVIAVGVALAAWQGRDTLRHLKLPAPLPLASLVWLAAAAALGLAVAGATLPPEMLRTADAYDVLEYHLQVPREFLAAGRIGPLQHNCYSYYPLGVEMLSLLAMCLRGGAYAGVYAAHFIHGAFGVLAVVALSGAMRRDEPGRGRFAAVLLATAPLAVALSWLAMVELAMVCYTALAVLWLRHWLRRGGWRAAACIGLALGAACAVKYLSVGFIVAPVAALMLLAPLLRRRLKDLAHMPLVAAATLLLFAPWLVRNAACTGNPVFPLATDMLGRGHWSSDSQQRWLAGHGPQARPPVPAPPRWQPPANEPGRVAMLWHNFVAARGFVLLLPLAAAGLFAAVRKRRGGDGWDLALGAILLVQVGVWAAVTHGMPARFLAPALVPLALLAGGGAACLTGPGGAPLWRRLGSAGVLIIVLGGNLYFARGEYKPNVPAGAEWHGADCRELTYIKRLAAVSGVRLADDARIMLVGDANGWYWPAGTIYATAFDPHPLAELAESDADAETILAALRASGVDYLYVDWAEIWRLARTYGYAPALSGELFDRRSAGRPPGLAVLERLEQAGMRRLADLPPPFSPAVPWQADLPPLAWPQATLYAMPWAPPHETAAAFEHGP